MEDSHQQHIPNFISYHLATGGQRLYVVGCYLAPRDAYTLESKMSAISNSPRGMDLLVAGNFSTYLNFLDGNKRDKATRAAMAMDRVERMGEPFLLIKILWK